MKGIFHIHTKYSFDGHLSPKKIIEYSKKIGAEFLCITDHNTIRGAIECKKLGILPIIVGAEYESDIGDIISLFLEEEIKEKSWYKIIEKTKKQEGLVVLPHPFRGHKLEEELVIAVDIIEVFNARCTEEQNAKAIDLAKKYNKPMIVGSDAHFLSELPLTMIEFNSPNIKEAIFSGKILYTYRSEPYNRILTGIIRLYKTEDLKIFVEWSNKLAKFLLKK